MPSITWWNRVEPRPRSDDVVEPLQAKVRDPLWLLARQWQLGEFQGTDSGSPAWVTLGERVSPMTSWAAPGGAAVPLAGSSPIEVPLTGEPFTPDLATRVELGQWLSRLLQEAGAADEAFLAEYPIAEAPADETDSAEALLRRVCAGRVIDGVAAYLAIKGSSSGLPPAPAAAVQAFVGWVEAALGSIADRRDAGAWQPERLEYAATVSAGSVGLEVHPDDRGSMDWAAFDVLTAGGDAAPAAPPPGPAAMRSIVPTHVRFKGMPNARFWDFEDATLDFGDLKPDKRDLARLALIDFMLVQSNDWFVLPVDVPVGNLVTIDALTVRDVFGVDTAIARADREAIGTGRWTMFSTTAAGSATADFFVVPPTAGQIMQSSRPIEEVRFARDEIANMVWAIENVLENAAGEPWLQRERFAALHANRDPSSPVSPVAALVYRIESPVPEYWIPFLPVALDPVQGIVALELAAAVAADGHTAVPPRGRILRPTGIPANLPYRLPEEEVPRNGLRVQRVVCRTRWLDGSTHLWQQRRVQPGTGETSSALRFDQALAAIQQA